MRDFALRDYDFNFSRRRVVLAALAGTLPSTWLYKYAYPSNCLAVRSIVPPGVKKPRHDQRIPYEVANEQGSQGDVIVIYTNQPNAELIYSHRVTDPTLFDPIFVSALGFLLASEIALPLTVKETIAEKMLNFYIRVSSRAAAVNMNEAEEGVDPEPEAIEYRNG